MARRQLRLRLRSRFRNILFLSLLVALYLNTGSAFIPLPLHTTSAMSTDKHPAKSNPLAAEGGDCSDSQPSKTGGGEPLQLLPEASNDPSIPSIKLGESIRFEEMGPVIINADGTTRRIDNWDQMTKQEQEVAWRRISKRNEARRKALLEQQQKESAEGKEE